MNQNINHKISEEDNMLIRKMLDAAIEELVQIAKDNEIYLVDHMHLCKTHEDVFNYLKHRVDKNGFVVHEK